jgi:hypothetical protein
MVTGYFLASNGQRIPTNAATRRSEQRIIERDESDEDVGALIPIA